MPRTAPRAKKENVRRYGGAITECGPTTASREAAAAGIRAATGADFVHPFNDARVIAGQGTCAVEFVGQTDGLDVVVAPIGGGGLVSGTCLALAALSPATEVVAAEPARADDACRSLEAGRLVTADAQESVADGLLASLKELTWHFVSRHVSAVLTVPEREIVDAMGIAREGLGMAIEPSSAVALAAVLGNRGAFGGRRVGIIVTGGNVDPGAVPRRGA